MPMITPYHLTFRSGLHVGSRGVDVDEARVIVPADTLFSALLSTWVQTGHEAAQFVQPFVTDPPEPPFLLSSAFPFAGDVRFYPAPVNLVDHFSKATVTGRGKALKRITWVSEVLLGKMLAGDALDEWLFPEDPYEEPDKGVALQGGELWLTREEVAGLPTAMRRKPDKPEDRPLRALRRLKVLSTQRTPRVSIDRVTNASNIFHAGRATFARGCGLWFGVKWLRPNDAIGNLTYPQIFHHLLTLLADEGLGGERTYGYGAFMFNQKDAVSLPDPLQHEPAYLLSRYHPREDELPGVLRGKGAAYRLESVAGWLYSPNEAGQRRKRLYLLGEGSLITWPGDPAGDVSDVKPEYDHASQPFPHPVWRYGLALAAGAKEAHHA